MKKILVTTDLSNNSKSALRFAIQLASQNGYDLTFFHVYHIPRPTSWSDANFRAFEESESLEVVKQLNKFVNNLYKNLELTHETRHCVAKNGTSVDSVIMDYANDHNYSFICISRKGHGKTARLFGSNISSLIKKSKVPVIAVPDNYRRTKISTITYLSDLMNLDKELKKINTFTEPLDLSVEMLHFKIPLEDIITPHERNSIDEKLAKFGVNAHYEELDYEKTLIENIRKVIGRTKPSMIIMFTDQKRTLFKKIFLSSISAEFSSMVKRPLLVFTKD